MGQVFTRARAALRERAQSRSWRLWVDLNDALFGDCTRLNNNAPNEGEVRRLLAAGADVNGTCDEDGWTLLHCAATGNCKDAAALLIVHGANVNAVDQYDRTPLYTAIQYDAVDVAKLLLEAGANTEDGSKLLREAAQWDAKGVARLLMTAGVHTNALSSCGVSALRVAVCNSSVDVARFLIAAGADITNGDDVCGWTLLQKAASRDYADMTKVLIAAGADAGAVDNRGNTALHSAAKNNAWNVAGILILAGAGVKARNESGETPLHVAARYNSKDVTGVLMLAGADNEAPDYRGRTAWSIAQRAGCDDDFFHPKHKSELPVFL